MVAQVAMAVVGFVEPMWSAILSPGRKSGLRYLVALMWDTMQMAHANLRASVDDEYWSKQMYDAVKMHATQVSTLLFGANAVFYQIRFEPSSTNVLTESLSTIARR
jgi:hypothetical protein